MCDALNCYPDSMTTVDIVYSYATAPSERVATALAHARDVYGIRKLTFDSASRTLRVEYDATRLNAAVVTKLVREAGLEIAPDIAEEQPVLASPAPPPVPPPAA